MSAKNKLIGAGFTAFRLTGLHRLASVATRGRGAVLMLHHIDEPATAERVQAGMEQVYREGKTLTKDVGGTSGTRAFADAVLQAMEAPVAQS